VRHRGSLAFGLADDRLVEGRVRFSQVRSRAISPTLESSEIERELVAERD
jgi:hypothetical protein